MALNRIGSNFLTKRIRKLSQLIIDYDKDWQGRGITALAFLAAGMTTGDIIVHDGTRLVRLQPGPLGYHLFSRAAGRQVEWDILRRP